MNKSVFRLSALAALLCLAGSLHAQEIPPRALVNLAAADAASQLVPSNPEITVASGTREGKPVLNVTMKPAEYPWPGLKLAPPQNEPSLNLGEYGHIEAKITNTGTKPLRLNMRVDAPGSSQERPWNTEAVNIAPGATSTLKVVFGYANNFQPSYPVKGEAIARVLFFTGKVTEEQTFCIESFSAAGPPGEKPAGAEASLRIKPKDGILLGTGVTIDPAKQLGATGGAQGTLDGSSLALSFPGSAAKQSVTLKPAKGKWHLGDACEVHVRMKNTGSVPLTPTVELASEGINRVSAKGESLAPGQSTELTVPFAAPTPWEGTSAADRKRKPGTGTDFASDKTDQVIISAEHAGSATLRIESITAATSVAVVPEWLGQRPPVEGEWVKTFEDNFDGNSVDLTKWNNTGANYWDGSSHWSKENTIVGGGVARMRYEKKTGYHNDDPKQKQTDQVCGYLDTFDKFKQRYGYFESRMKLPTAPGLWPAFWCMPDRGPAAGDKPGSKAIRCNTGDGGMEFDIMEHLTIWGPHRYNIAMHWDNYGKDHKAIGTGKIYAKPDKDGFITSGMLWLPGKVVYYCNGQEVFRWEDPRICNVPVYMMYTMPVGGWDGNFFDGTGVPADFVIDYTRVWQRKDLLNQ